MKSNYKTCQITVQGLRCHDLKFNTTPTRKIGTDLSSQTEYKKIKHMQNHDSGFLFYFLKR